MDATTTWTIPGTMLGKPRWTAVAGFAALTSALLLMGLLSFPSGAYAAEAPVGLGTVGSYSVLGAETVTNTGPSLLSADVGVSPGSAITGFPPGVSLGTEHRADAHAAQAQLDLGVAYDDARSRAPTGSIAGDLVGRTFTAGVYNSSGPIGLGGTMTLDGQGDPRAVFIFQIAETLITAPASRVNVINGAQACNVFWQVASSATLDTGTGFVGTIMASTSISVLTGATVEGRALARTGQVSLDTNVFTVPGCDTTTPTSSTTTNGAAAAAWDAVSAITTATPSDSTTVTTTTAAVAGPSTSTPGTTRGPAGGGPGGPGGSGRTGSASGPPELANTGVDASLSPLLGVGVLMLALGGLMLAVAQSKARHRRQH